MNIGMFAPQLHLAGGIERVVKELFRIAETRGHHCWALCEYGKPSWISDAIYELLPIERKARTAALKTWVRNFCPHVVIFHYTTKPHLIREDVELMRSLGVLTIAAMHSSFPSPLLLDNDEKINRVFHLWAKACDCVATVSAIDALWWRGMGCRAFHVQNPFVPPKMKAERDLGRRNAPRNVLWVGRQAQPKQPSVALVAFVGVVKAVPDAHLTMVGGSDKEWRRYWKLAKQLGIEKNVTFLGASDDISELWEKADFHLLSSVTESFCLVLAEAKAWGLPTVMFDIPFLELTESKKGLLIAPQGDVEGLAQQMIRLMTEPGLCERLGVEAKESLAPFNDEAVWASWERVFEALKTGEGGREVAPEVKTIVTQMNFAWDNFCDRNLWSVKFTREWQLFFWCSWEPMAKLVSGLVAGVRKLKAMLRK